LIPRANGRTWPTQFIIARRIDVGVADLPFLTLPDPVTTGEGALDPLGLSTIGDRLAEQVLPGLRARMARPRFLTAIAVSAAVCDGLEDRIASDNVTPSYIVFEWLLVQAFVRASDQQNTQRTPGTQKAQEAKESGEPMCARAYLRVPSVFGFHGVYKPLARNLGIVDDGLRLCENGYALVKEWQAEQGLEGFLASSVASGRGTPVRQLLRSAVEDGLREGFSKRSGSWQGWSLLADHLAPAKIGAREAAFVYRLLLDSRGGSRGEVFDLLKSTPADDLSESAVVRDMLLPGASGELQSRLRAIVEYEAVGTLVEDAFDWIRYLSSKAGARAITTADYAAKPDVHGICSDLGLALRRAESALTKSPLSLQQEFATLSKSFDRSRTPADLFESVLSHHHEVQQAKQPEGKRDWFERTTDGATFVRVPYRLADPVQPRDWWSRPYRIDTARSFWKDLRIGNI
jgi:hypothetical protein